MAITQIEYALVRRLKDEGMFPENPSILELGQSNWYGDVPTEDFVADIKTYVPGEDESGALVQRAMSLAETTPDRWLFHMADVFWQVFLRSHTYEAIDLHGVDERAHKLDLNEPVDLGKRFDVVCNFGTAEHVFNVHQVFKTIHDLTKPGGLMLHGLPFQGWVDHGFYTFQPTFFFDLAEANNYVPAVFLYAEVTPPRIVSIKNRETIHEMAEKNQIGPNAMLFTALRKRSGGNAFQSPMQAYYARRLDKAAANRWTTLR